MSGLAADRGLDALARARRVGEPAIEPEEVPEPDYRALTASPHEESRDRSVHHLKGLDPVPLRSRAKAHDRGTDRGISPTVGARPDATNTRSALCPGAAPPGSFSVIPRNTG